MTTEVARPQAVAGKEYQLFINGQWTPASSGETLERRYPANTDVLVATFPAASEQDVDNAIQAARDAFDKGGWAKAPAKQRADVLRKTADKIRAEMNDLAKLLASEVGKPVTEASMEVALTAEVFEYYAGLAMNVKGSVLSNYVDDALGTDPEGAGGRRRDHHAVELPDAAGDLEARAGAGRRLHDRREAGDLHAVHDLRARRASSPRPARLRASLTS